MYNLRVLSLLASFSLTLSSPFPNTDSPAACPSGVHVISARGSGQPQGLGKFDTLVPEILDAIPHSTQDPLVYPAQLKPYKPSEEAGVRNLTAALEQYHASCPQTPLVLLGSSQGAQVIVDTLAGGGPLPPIDKTYTRNLLAVVLFGDPTHLGQTDYDKGNCTGPSGHGRLDRGSQSADILDSYATVLESWCTEGDYWCCSGDSTYIHGHEIEIHQDGALDFIKKKAKAKGLCNASCS